MEEFLEFESETHRRLVKPDYLVSLFPSRLDVSNPPISVAHGRERETDRQGDEQQQQQEEEEEDIILLALSSLSGLPPHPTHPLPSRLLAKTRPFAETSSSRVLSPPWHRSIACTCCRKRKEETIREKDISWRRHLLDGASRRKTNVYIFFFYLKLLLYEWVFNRCEYVRTEKGASFLLQETYFK